MLFTNLVLLGLGYTSSIILAAPAAVSDTSDALPLDLFKKGVPLEFGKEYTNAELIDLAVKFNKRAPVALSVPIESEFDVGLEKRRTEFVDTVFETVNAVFTCPAAGSISRSMRAKASITRRLAGVGGDIAFEGMFNIEGFVPSGTGFGPVPALIDTTARHAFCETYPPTTICSYQMVVEFQARILQTAAGDQSPTLHDLDAQTPKMYEACVHVAPGGGPRSCPAVSIISSGLCTLTHWSSTNN